MKIAKITAKKSPKMHWLLMHYDVLSIQGTDKLIVPIQEQNLDVIYYIHDGQLFDILYDIHVSTGHGGRDRMIKQGRSIYKNLIRADISSFVNLCAPCQMKQKKEKKGIVSKPMVFDDLNSRCQVDLIDYQSHPDGPYKFIMVYQDHLTKFVILRSLKSKCAVEVADKLIEIFTLFGAPTVLQSDNGREFCNNVILEITKLWSDLKMVHGKPRHSQSQGSVERANQDVENMLTTWMQTNNTAQWNKGLQFVQFMKNTSLHSAIKMSPYEAMFGGKAKVGLKTSNIPLQVLKDITKEEELKSIIDGIVIEDAKVGNEIEGAASTNDNSIPKSPTISAQVVDEEMNEKISTRINEIQNSRKEAHDGLIAQGVRMQTTSDNKHPKAEVGTTVRIPIPEVDRGRGDSRSILAVVTEATNDGFYRLGTEEGTISKYYCRSEFTPCPVNILNVAVPAGKEVSLRSVATANSTGHGQGFRKCSCQTKCTTKKCACRKSDLLCTSKCHKSLTCCNK